MKFCRNMHPFDQVIRLLLGGVLVYFGFFSREVIADPLLGTLVGVFGLLNLVSGLMAVCPIYLMANINTAKLFRTRH